MGWKTCTHNSLWQDVFPDINHGTAGLQQLQEFQIKQNNTNCANFLSGGDHLAGLQKELHEHFLVSVPGKMILNNADQFFLLPVKKCFCQPNSYQSFCLLYTHLPSSRMKQKLSSYSGSAVALDRAVIKCWVLSVTGHRLTSMNVFGTAWKTIVHPVYNFGTKWMASSPLLEYYQQGRLSASRPRCHGQVKWSSGGGLGLQRRQLRQGDSFGSLRFQPRCQKARLRRKGMNGWN